MKTILFQKPEFNIHRERRLIYFEKPYTTPENLTENAKNVRSTLKENGANETELFTFDQAYDKKTAKTIKRYILDQRKQGIKTNVKQPETWRDIHNALTNKNGPYYSEIYERMWEVHSGTRGELGELKEKVSKEKITQEKIIQSVQSVEAKFAVNEAYGKEFAHAIRDVIHDIWGKGGRFRRVILEDNSWRLIHQNLITKGGKHYNQAYAEAFEKNE